MFARPATMCSGSKCGHGGRRKGHGLSSPRVSVPLCGVLVVSGVWSCCALVQPPSRPAQDTARTQPPLRKPSLLSHLPGRQAHFWSPRNSHRIASGLRQLRQPWEKRSNSSDISFSPSLLAPCSLFIRSLLCARWPSVMLRTQPAAGTVARWQHPRSPLVRLRPGAAPGSARGGQLLCVAEGGADKKAELTTRYIREIRACSVLFSAVPCRAVPSPALACYTASRPPAPRLRAACGPQVAPRRRPSGSKACRFCWTPPMRA